ncbi:HtaA domain-containing protein [Streptomyces sp. NRRL F-5650]|uniref:HtaA domain-containing protein n=1 Tax=Streptomyces sp. NRRL F-5650 TaxID=1463868 RepID=UPI0004C75B0A|nr:HtaA domain-containing protein [Streptomyces sp. NRRL F-5650]
MPARLRALLTVVCAVLLGALPTAPAAHAESRTVQGGRLDWGIRASFQSYVTGPVAKGSYSLTQGAATVGGSTFRFHSATGTYDPATGAFRAAFSGGVHFLGHRTSDGAHQLDLTLSRPTVSVSGGTGTLHVDVTSRAKDTGAVTTSRQVPFASLSLGGIDMRGGDGTVTLNNLPATLTAEGARSFAGYYTAGTALDPVSLSADVGAAAPSPSSTPTRTAESPASEDTSGGAVKDGAVKDGAVKDGAVDWGVRRTFREYVTGDIADGRWTLTAGAQDGGALFRFPGGEGTYEDGGLTATFKGTVRFTGAHGLDLTLGGVRVAVKDGTGTLYADVRSPDVEEKKVPLVTFTAGRPKPADGLVRFTEAPARLTERGARAFGGMYPAGTEMDPVSLAVALTADAHLPALPDLGSTPTPGASPRPTRTAGADTSAAPVASTARGGDFPALPVSLAAGALLSAAAALVAVALRRRRARPAASPGDPNQG